MIGSLKIITWNARGINNKKMEFFQFLETNYIDICLLTETWLKSDNSFCHELYSIYRCDRESRVGGGVAIVINKKIKHALIPNVDCNLVENVGVKVFSNVGSVNIYSCYFPGGQAGANGSRKTIFASDLHKLTRSEKYIIGGDFNSRHSSWGCLRSNCWGNILYDKQNSYEYDLLHPFENTFLPSQLCRQSSILDFFYNLLD